MKEVSDGENRVHTRQNTDVQKRGARNIHGYSKGVLGGKKKKRGKLGSGGQTPGHGTSSTASQSKCRKPGSSRAGGVLFQVCETNERGEE